MIIVCILGWEMGVTEVKWPKVKMPASGGVSPRIPICWHIALKWCFSSGHSQPFGQSHLDSHSWVTSIKQAKKISKGSGHWQLPGLYFATVPNHYSCHHTWKPGYSKGIRASVHSSFPLHPSPSPASGKEWIFVTIMGPFEVGKCA